MTRMSRAELRDANGGSAYIHELVNAILSATNLDGSSFTIPVASGTPTASDILAGRQATTATTSAITIITIPAGRTWSGEIGASVTVSVAAGTTTAGQASALISVAGANASPSAGIYVGVDTRVGASMATSINGAASSNFASSPITIAAPAGNAVTVQVATTNIGTVALVDAFALGKLL